MILFLLALAAPQEAPIDMLSDQEIVIVGKRLQGITVNVGRDPKGRWHCGLEGTTGYPKLDEQLCRATTKCVQKGKSGDAAVKACVARTKPDLIAQLRKRAGSGSR